MVGSKVRRKFRNTIFSCSFGLRVKRESEEMSDKFAKLRKRVKKRFFMHWMHLVILIIPFTISSSFGSSVVNEKSETAQRRGKVFNIFQLVRFPNDVCIGSGSKNGTCYTELECEERNGISSGSCAQGFGVCCVFSRGCGSVMSENCTFFEVSNPQIGPCSLTVCPASNNICQLRLDFNTFTIAGPSTDTANVVNLINGSPSKESEPNAVKAALSTRCLIDTFSVTNPGGMSPPEICGINSGDHMYVGSSSQCNILNFAIGSSSISATRQWSIKVTQIGCDSQLLPPLGCTQYYTGTTGLIQSYNFNGNLHLANQNQRICFRQERGNCRICFTAQNPADFALSYYVPNGVGVNMASNCCRYGVNGLNTRGYDCVQIPRATRNTDGRQRASRFCGRSSGLFNGVAGGKGGTICSNLTPFSLHFTSDNFELTGPATTAGIPAGSLREAASPDIGFKLFFFQDNTRCYTPA